MPEKERMGIMRKSLKITETSIMLAMALILSFIKIIDMPFGGSVTAFSMLPVIIIAYRHKAPWGLMAGLAYSVIEMLLGMKNLTYATSAAAVVAIILLDYTIAFTVLGLGGIFRGKIKNQGLALMLGTLFVCVLRYICHVISGCTVWAGVSIPDAAGLIYSLAYNAAYMIPETVVTMVAAFYVGSAFTIGEEKIKRLSVSKGAYSTLYASIPVALAVVVDFLIIFGMLQTEEGFDITALMNAEVKQWIIVLCVFGVGVILSVLIKLFTKRTEKV